MQLAGQAFYYSHNDNNTTTKALFETLLEPLLNLSRNPLGPLLPRWKETLFSFILLKKKMHKASNIYHNIHTDMNTRWSTMIV